MAGVLVEYVTDPLMDRGEDRSLLLLGQNENQWCWLLAY